MARLPAGETSPRSKGPLCRNKGRRQIKTGVRILRYSPPPEKNLFMRVKTALMLKCDQPVPGVKTETSL